MPRAVVVVQPRVRQLLNELGAWPRTIEFMKWVRDKNQRPGRYDADYKIKTEELTRLRKGLAVDRRILQALVEWHDSNFSKPTPDGKRATQFYLALLTLKLAKEFDEKDFRRLVSQLTDEELDYLAGPDSRIAALRADRFLHARRPHATELEVREAIRWMYVEHGRNIARIAAKLSTAEAIGTAESHIGISLADYQRRALTWKRRCPWTVVLARAHGVVAGISIELPLRPEVYRALRAGKLFASEVSAADLQCPSRFVFLEAHAARPIEQMQKLEGNLTIYLATTADAQLGHLSKVRGAARNHPLHLLSRQASPKTQGRLEDWHFRSTGTREHKTGLSLMELILDPGGPGSHLVTLGVVNQLAALTTSAKVSKPRRPTGRKK